MGLEESRPLCQQLNTSEGDEGFVVISNDLPGAFHFNPSESFAVGFGIDKQTSPQFKHKSLTHITVDDAKQVLDSFVAVGAVCSKNAHLFSASKQPSNCTAQGVKEVFQTFASQVGPDGLFLFHFSGHGIKVRNDMWGLAPMDFDYSTATYITAEVLSKWLNEIQCKAKYILITLDCCYAGGIGKELTGQADVRRGVNLYVLSACTANETSLVLGSLGHSIFTYFLSHFVLKLSKDRGHLPMREIFSECQACCECLSSLLVTYSEESGLQLKVMQPQFAVRNIVSDDKEEVDAAVPIGRFQDILKLYNQALKIHPLDDKSLAYLDSLRDIPDGPLFQLERRGLLTGKVILSVICSIVYSLASIEVACDSNLAKVKNLNLSITAFMQAASAIDMIHHDVEFDGLTFFLSWQFYKEVMRRNHVVLGGIKQFEARVRQFYRLQPRQESGNVPTARGVDMTDSGEVDATPVVSCRVVCYDTILNHTLICLYAGRRRNIPDKMGSTFKMIDKSASRCQT